MKRRELVLAIASIPLLDAQEFKSEPFGREIITVEDGFNYVGLRFHRKPVASGEVLVVNQGSVIVGIPNEAINELNSTDSFLFEVDTGSAIGAVVPITSYDAPAGTVTLNDDLSADLQVGDRFTLRPSATLASVFGETNSAGLDGASSAGAADQIFVPDGLGGFKKYYYFSLFGNEEWRDVDTDTLVDPHAIDLYYPDGLVIKGLGPTNSFKVAGVVKKTPTTYVIRQGFNYLSSIYPCGGSIGTMFGPNNEAGLIAGFGGVAGADIIFWPDPLSPGTNLQYYREQLDFNTFVIDPYWSEAASTGNPGPIDPFSVSFDPNSGYILLGAGTVDRAITVYSPSFYNDL